MGVIVPGEPSITSMSGIESPTFIEATVEAWNERAVGSAPRASRGKKLQRCNVGGMVVTVVVAMAMGGVGR